MKYKFFALAVLFFALTPLSGEIVECHDIKQALDYVDEDSSLFLEIDGVILLSKTSVGSPIFFRHLQQKMLQQGIEPERVAHKLYPLWVSIQKSNSVELADPSLPLLLGLLQEKGVPVMALSHRGVRLASDSGDQLRKLGIFLTPLHRDLVFEENMASYSEGMLMIHPACNKGEYLLRFFEASSFQPKKIVCVDYELMNLVHIQQALEERGIAFTGIYMRPVNENCDIEVANIQLQFLDKILPDEVAHAIVYSNED